MTHQTHIICLESCGLQSGTIGTSRKIIFIGEESIAGAKVEKETLSTLSDAFLVELVRFYIFSLAKWIKVLFLYNPSLYFYTTLQRYYVPSCHLHSVPTIMNESSK